MRRAAALVLVLLAPAGCLGEGPAAYAVRGAFTPDATPAQIEEAQAIARADGGDMLVMESFPPRFAVLNLTSFACERIHDKLAEKPYMGQLDACARQELGGPSEETVSSGG